MNRKKSIIAGSVSLILILGYFLFFFQKKGSERYIEAEVKRGNIEITILATGTVQPENRLEIKPPVAGRMDRVLVNEGDKLTKGQIIAWMSSTERAALIDSARSQGVEELKKWEDLYKPTPVVAPMSGTLIKRNIEPGQTFTVSDAVLVMSNRLTIKAQVDETDLAQIKINQDCDVRLDSYPDIKISSRVERIAFEAKTVNNVTTYVIDVLPLSTPEFMRSGMTANITFFVKNKENVLTVPTEFLNYENGKPFLLVKSAVDNHKEKKVEVKVGESQGKNTEILSGVEEKEKIILKVTEQEQKKSNPFMPFNNRSKKASTSGSSSGANQRSSSGSSSPPPGP
ncbi:MAG: efflux RND transporter periplasmic adaptor subunit [Bdellovibrionaceae bacterium]|nr:efflux RND transporter periplasmic adaptor subunit [Pseudobdellovibrionaceae bacterium]